MKNRLVLLSASALAVAAFSLACSSTEAVSPNSGTMVVKLTDAPFLADSVRSVDIYVVRVEGRLQAADSTESDTDLESGSSKGWITLASPNASYNLLALQNGVSATLGSASLPAGTYSGFRFIIDPSKSSLTLKNGRVLSGTSSPNVTFPSASRSGIKINPSEPVRIVGGATTTFLVDFDVDKSFVMRGNSIEKNGLLFKPNIKASIVDAATTNANVRLVNATNSPLSLLRGGTALSGAANLASASASTCSSVSATTPALTVVQASSTTPLTGFAPAFAAGGSYTLVAYPGAGSAVQFATLSNTYAATAGQAGLRVINTTGGTTGVDVFVTASGAPLTTATVSNVLTGASSSFVSVPAGSSQVRIVTTGGTTVLFDAGAQTFTAGQNTTLVIAPPAAGATTPRAFLVAGC